jgi:hypothetical protein
MSRYCDDRDSTAMLDVTKGAQELVSNMRSKLLEGEQGRKIMFSNLFLTIFSHLQVVLVL